MRCANQGRPFTAGLYLGRHVNADLYRLVTPAECMATLVAAGCCGLHVYGYSGLDDGGVLYRMDSLFKDSLRLGNRWASEVIPLLKSPRAKEVAILFPAEMSLYEPLEVDEGGRHRMDLLGWYMQFTDLGWSVDILHPAQVEKGVLCDYRYLVVPTNSLYDLGENTAMEVAVAKFVASGGTLFHGPDCLLAQRLFGVKEEAIEFDCIKWREELIPHGWSTAAFQGAGQTVASYIQSGRTCIALTEHGRGKVYSMGFQYGYSYSRLTMPIVPPAYGKREMHPLVLLKETPIASWVGVKPALPGKAIRGVEYAQFGKQWVIVNHRSSPVHLDADGSLQARYQIPMEQGWLAGHSAVLLENA
jgi:hypothetical protein